MSEEAILGWLLLHDFDDARNRAIFEAMADLASEGQPVDAITVSERCKRLGTWRNGLDSAYLLSLVAAIP